MSLVPTTYLVSVLRLEYSPKGSSRRNVEETMMDCFQDFVYSLEDEKITSEFPAEAFSSMD